MEYRLKLALAIALTISPAYAGGSMAPDVRIIHVSPSIDRYGSKADKATKMEQLKQAGRVELEELQSINRRRFEADKAYYSKLKDQRKHK